MKFYIQNLGAKEILYLYEPIDMKFSQMSDRSLSIFMQPKLVRVVSSDSGSTGLHNQFFAFFVEISLSLCREFQQQSCS